MLKPVIVNEKVVLKIFKSREQEKVFIGTICNAKSDELKLSCFYNLEKLTNYI